jgi:hypothetical protein
MYRQGGRNMFHVTITLAQLTQLVPKRPDPNEPIEGNRRVDARRARAFGYYVLEKDDWVSPAIIVRAPSGEVEFDTVHAFDDGTAWGILKIPLHVLTEILLLDGQHRTLGTFIAIDEVNERIRSKRDSLEAARRDENPAVIAEIEGSLNKLLAMREKLNLEHIAIDIALVTTSQAKQMFVDIANNAKGINRDFTTILDQRDVINRIAAELIENHPLLEDRVELGQSNRRLSPNNPNFVGAKTVADVARAVQVGVSGRIGARVEDELSRNLPEAVAKVETFLDLLVAAFPELQDLIDGDLDAGELRTESSPRRSMIASATMLRALAGAYHDLTEPATGGGAKPLKRSELEMFFASLAPRMRMIPIAEDDDFWMPTGAFLSGSSAPQGSQGPMIALTRSLVGWAREELDGEELDGEEVDVEEVDGEEVDGDEAAAA